MYLDFFSNFTIKNSCKSFFNNLLYDMNKTQTTVLVNILWDITHAIISKACGERVY